VTKTSGEVSKKQIAAYYKKNHATFVIPTTLDLHLIETNSESSAAHVKSLLASGSSYAVLAPKYSIDPTTKSAGGEMLSVRPTQLTAVLSAAVFKATPGTLTGPVKTPFGYYVFTVDSRTPGKVQSLAEATSTIKSTIAAAQEQKANAKLENDFSKKWTDLTKCATGYIVSPSCSNAPKTGSTGATGAG
jgi:foldase protein PrsA